MTALPTQLRRRIGLALTLAPAGVQVLAVVLLGVNTVLWDEFFYVDFLRDVFEGRNWWHWLTLQHNEHRVVPMKLVMAPLARLTGWDTRAEMLVSAVLALVLVAGLWRLYRQVGGRDLLLFAPTAWLVCSLAQYENILYGLMMCHYFTLAGVVWALVLLAGGGARAFAGAVLCALTASFSILNGVLVWPLGIALLLVRRRWLATVAWLGASGLALAAYFHNFQLPPNPGGSPPIAVATALRMGRYGIKMLGGPLAAGSIAWSAVIGLLIAAGAAVVAWRWRRGQALDRDAPLAGLLAFGALSCVMIAAGRAAWAGSSPLQSRYVAYSSLVLIAVYLAIARDAERSESPGRPRLVLIAALAVLLPGLLAANVEGLHAARVWRGEQLQQRLILTSFDRQPKDRLGAVYFPDLVPRGAAFLRQHRLGPFADAVEVLVLVRWREGVAGGEIVPGHPIEQTLVCPVGEVRDVAVPFVTYGRQNRSHVTVSVWEGGRRLGSRELAAAQLRDNGWVRVPVRVRRCLNRRLLIRIESADARPGDAVTVWTYPRYYEGELRQAGTPQIAGRSLGLTINGFASGMLSE